MALSVDKSLRKAQSLTNKGQRAEAEAIYQQVLKKFPGSKKAIDAHRLFKAGVVANGRMRSETPQQSLIDGLTDLLSRHRYGDVLDQTTALISLYPTSANLFQIRGVAHANLEQFERAVSNFRSAVAISPNDVALLRNLGAALNKNGELEAAIEAYQKALVMAPHYAEAYFNLANAQFASGDLAGAVDNFKQSIKLSPKQHAGYYNLGMVLSAMADFDGAIDIFRQSIAIAPNFILNYLELGNAQTAKGDLTAATESFRQVLTQMPDHAKAQNGLGDISMQQGDFSAATEHFQEAHNIEPVDVEILSNLATAYFRVGEIQRAIDIFNRALRIDPHHRLAWQNIYFCLKVGPDSDPPTPTEAMAMLDRGPLTAAPLQAAILQFLLETEGLIDPTSYPRAIERLGEGKTSKIANPQICPSRPKPRHKVPQKMVALLHFGRSGTGLLHSLIDGHCEVSTLPSIYFSEYFDSHAWEKLTSGGWDALVDKFIATYPVLFNAKASTPVATAGNTSIASLGVKEGMANVGGHRDEILTLDEKRFRKALDHLMACCDELDAFSFFQLVHCAYEYALNNNSEKNVIFYHIHNPAANAKLNFARKASDVKWLMMVREPIQCLESWCRTHFEKNAYESVANAITRMLSDVNQGIFRNHAAAGLRLEDLKEYPKETISALCDWIGVANHETLYEMTAQGKRWWGDPTSPDFGKEGLTPFGKSSIERKIGAIFSVADQLVLKTLFYPFRVAFGYTEHNLEQFKRDLREIRPSLDKMFDFELRIAEKTGTATEQFMRSGVYRHLRVCLIERWIVLNEQHSYPDMLQPLLIKKGR